MKNFKFTAVWIICTILLTGCEPELASVHHELNTNTQNHFSSGPTCDGKPIMKYGSLGEIQDAHRDLYNEYEATQDEQTLNDWEDNLSFYSLRKKDEDMDNGIIPEDPNFESWNYTSDIILETILNQDGMVIIDGFLYLWDDGCVIHRIPYNSCSDYDTMLDFSTFIRSYDGSPAAQEKMSYYVNDKKITNIDTCQDNRFDFETISTENLSIKNDPPRNKAKNGSACGFESYITHEILSHDAVNSRISLKLTANFIAPIGSEPLSSFYISNVSEFTSVTIVAGSIPMSGTIDWKTAGAGWAYPGKEVYVDINYTDFNTFVPLLLVDLIGTINPLGGDSCTDNDTLALNLNCPISISKKPLDAKNGKWLLTMEGIANAQNYGVTWDFGDNSPVETVMNDNSVIHTFPTPCDAENFNVSATLEKLNLCKNTASTTLKSWDTCKRQKMNEVFKQKVDGKRMKLKIKIKNRWAIFGGTKIIHKFRYRKNGTKTISPTGSIFKSSGMNCVPQDINSIVSSESQSGKKRLKQRFVTNDTYKVDLEMPYSVKFSHSNGFSHTLTYSGTCSK